MAPAGGVTQAILTCSPHFIDLALNEVRRYHRDAIVLQHLAPGHILLEVQASFEALTLPWRNRLPVYLHHLFPVHAVMPVEAARGDLTQLRQAVRRMAPPDAAVQVRSTLETEAPNILVEVQRSLSRGQPPYSLDPPTGRIVSVLITQEQEDLQAYLGMSWANQNLSPWTGGQIPVTEPVSNRAGYKLLEALTTFSIRLRQGDHALDLGAAPGAWTTLLRQRGLRVTAVAPTPLYPWLMFDAHVTYQPMTAEQFLGCCRSTFDLIVNDMRLDAQDSARIMADYASHLRRGGIAIMTLKLHGHNHQRVMDHTFRLLRKRYKIIRVRQLVSNRHEVTLFLRSKL